MLILFMPWLPLGFVMEFGSAEKQGSARPRVHIEGKLYAGYGPIGMEKSVELIGPMVL